MKQEHHQPAGFFPHLLSVVVFAAIMVGMFFVFTSLYPQLVQRLQSPPVVTPVSNTSEDLAPFVRGIISGIKVANLFVGQLETQPIDITLVKGYQQGIKTALLASKDWYDLDRQLFRSRGIALGVQAAADTSKPTLERATLEYQVKLIQQLQNALATNLEDLLGANSSNRRQVLQNYLDGLKKLLSEATVELANMERVIQESQAQLEQNTQTAQQYSENFTTDTTEFRTENIDRNLDLFVQSQKLADEARVVVNSTGQIYNRLKPLADRMPVVIAAIEANFEALAAGIKVAPVQGVNLPIIQEN